MSRQAPRTQGLGLDVVTEAAAVYPPYDLELWVGFGVVVPPPEGDGLWTPTVGCEAGTGSYPWNHRDRWGGQSAGPQVLEESSDGGSATRIVSSGSAASRACSSSWRIWALRLGSRSGFQPGCNARSKSTFHQCSRTMLNTVTEFSGCARLSETEQEYNVV